MVNDKTVMDLLETGARAEGLRQQAIASNVANMNTNGYRRVDVNFETLLQQAMDKDENVDMNQLEVEFYQTKNTPVNEFGNDVSLDTEVGKMVENTLKHKAYMSLLKKKYQQMDLAAKL